MCSFKIKGRERETVFLRKWQNEKLLETAIRITPAHGFSSSSLHSAHSCFPGGFALSAPTEILHWCFPRSPGLQGSSDFSSAGQPRLAQAPTLGSAPLPLHTGPKAPFQGNHHISAFHLLPTTKLSAICHFELVYKFLCSTMQRS